MSITVGSRVRIIEADLGYFQSPTYIGLEGTVTYVDESDPQQTYKVDLDHPGLVGTWPHTDEVEPVEPDHLAIKECGTDAFLVRGRVFYYSQDSDALQDKGQCYLAAAEHIRAHKPKVIEEPTETGARLEVDGTFDNQGKRVMVYRLPGVGNEDQVWVEFTTNGGQFYSVWTWDRLKTRNPKVVP